MLFKSATPLVHIATVLATIVQGVANTSKWTRRRIDFADLITAPLQVAHSGSPSTTMTSSIAPLAIITAAIIASQGSRAVEFPNSIVGRPRVECGEGQLTVSVDTKDGVASRVFAKGFNAEEKCHFDQTNTATFPFTSACNVNRQRQNNPKGVSYSLTVIVQLHPLFITKVDRAYNIKCFYMEAEKTVTQGFDVSALPTEVFEVTHAQPQCMYQLHIGSPNGPSTKYAKVGDKVWHVWDCPSDVYGMLVHSCTVSDGHGTEFTVIDKHGCGVDEFIVQTPEYTNQLTRAQQETHVFKFPDSISVGFNCQIKLCFINGDACNGITPPNCDSDSNTNKTGKLRESVIAEDAATTEQSLVKIKNESTTSISTTTTTTESPTTTEATSTEATPTRTNGADVLTSEQLLPVNSSDRLTFTTMEPFPTPSSFPDTIEEIITFDGSGLGEDAINNNSSFTSSITTDAVNTTGTAQTTPASIIVTSTTSSKTPSLTPPRGRRDVFLPPLPLHAYSTDRQLQQRRLSLANEDDSLVDLDINQQLTVLDREELGEDGQSNNNDHPIDGDSSSEQLMAGRTGSSSLFSRGGPGRVPSNRRTAMTPPNRVCVSTLGFTMLVITFVISLVVSTMGAATILMRSRMRRRTVIDANYDMQQLKYY